MSQSISVQATLIIQLDSKSDWVNKIPNKLPKKLNGEHFLFLDKNGNALFLGLDFKLAEENNLFPVKVYRLESVLQKINNVKTNW